MSDDDNIAWHIWVGIIVTIVPATLLVALRFVARTYGPSPAGLAADDWLILSALIVNWAMAAIRLYQVVVDSYGRHAWTLPDAVVSDFQKSFLAVQETYFTNATLTKLSLLYLYYRIFGVSRRFRAALWCACALVVVWFVTCVVVSIAGCHPVSWFWDKKQPGGGWCIDEVMFFRVNGIVNMILDVLVLLLPISMVWKLDLEFRQKIVVTAIFMLGTFVCVVSILRIVAFDRSDQSDPTYTTVDTAMWSSIEQSVGIVCACLPTIRPLFRLMRHRYLTSRRASEAASRRRHCSSSYQLDSVDHPHHHGDGGAARCSTLGGTTIVTAQSEANFAPWKEEQQFYERGVKVT